MAQNTDINVGVEQLHDLRRWLWPADSVPGGGPRVRHVKALDRAIEALTNHPTAQVTDAIEQAVAEVMRFAPADHRRAVKAIYLAMLTTDTRETEGDKK